MRIEEALLRSPRLRLLPPDGERCRAAWERILVAVEGVGAALEAPQEGLCYLPVAPLLALYRSPSGVARAVRHALARTTSLPYRLGLGTSRFYAHLAARRQRGAGLPCLSPASGEAAAFPLAALSLHPWEGALMEELEELGLTTLGEVRALGKGALGERFGRQGERLAELLAGREPPFLPRRPPGRVEERLELEGSLTVAGLRQAVAVLLERLLARPELKGRSVARLSLSAQLAGGGSWQVGVPFRQPTTSRKALLDRCAAKLLELPAPPLSVAVGVEGVGPAAGRQLPLGAREGKGRLGEAIAHLQRNLGGEAVGKVVPLEEGAWVPERRFLLGPPEVEGR